MNAKIRWQSVSLSVTTIKDLRIEWEDLAANAVEQNIFLFPFFIEASIPLLEEQHPKLISIYNDNILIGLFIVSEDIGYAKLPLKFYRTALHPDIFLATPLVREGFAEQFALGLCQWLDDCPTSITFNMLSLLSLDNSIGAAIQKISQSQDRPVIIVEKHKRAAIKPSSQHLEAVIETLSKNRRKGLQRKIKNLSALGDINVEKLKNPNDIDQWIEGFLQMEHSGWKGENQSSTLSITEDTEFFRAMVRNASDNKMVNFFRLTLDDRAIAYTLDLKAEPFGYCVKSSFDETYRKYAPGVLLEYETLKYYLAQKEFDIIDSCTAPNNVMLNDIWPDRREIITMVMLRSGKYYQWPLLILFWLKDHLKRVKNPNKKPKLKILYGA